MIPAARLPDWPERLAAYIDRVRDRAFCWGEHDCVIFAAGAIDATTGADVLQGLRWAGIGGAHRQLEVEGGIESAVSARLGPPLDPRLAQRGDIALLADGGVQWVAVCIGDHAVAPHSGGLVARPMTLAVCAWGVGRG